MTAPVDKLRAVYASHHPHRDPAAMPFSDTERAMLELFYREMDARSWVKKLPAGHALNYTPQPSVGFGMCEIE